PCSHELHALPLFHTDLPHWWAHARNRRPASTASEPQNIEERPGSGDPGQPNDSPWITCRVFRATTPATRPRNSGGCSRLRRSVLIHIYSNQIASFLRRHRQILKCVVNLVIGCIGSGRQYPSINRSRVTHHDRCSATRPCERPCSKNGMRRSIPDCERKHSRLRPLHVRS